MKNKYIKPQGSALITAIFIMTLISITVISMIERLQLDIYQTQVTIDSDKLYLASDAVLFWAKDQLKKRNLKFRLLNKKGAILIFPKQYINIYPGVKTQGKVYDLQSKFNLNNLSDISNQNVFLNLIAKVIPKLSSFERKFITEATTNWVSGHVNHNSGQDKWLNRYLNKKPVYLPAYQLMHNISEFRSVYKVDTNIYNKLLPYITALPEITPININTASKELLMSLTSEDNKKIIDSIIKLRSKKYIKDINQINITSNALKIKENQLSTSSNYYLVVANTSTPNLSYKIYTTLKLNTNNNKNVEIEVIQQSFNTE